MHDLNSAVLRWQQIGQDVSLSLSLPLLLTSFLSFFRRLLVWFELSLGFTSQWFSSAPVAIAPLGLIGSSTQSPSLICNFSSCPSVREKEYRTKRRRAQDPSHHILSPLIISSPNDPNTSKTNIHANTHTQTHDKKRKGDQDNSQVKVPLSLHSARTSNSVEDDCLSPLNFLTKSRSLSIFSAFSRSRTRRGLEATCSENKD